MVASLGARERKGRKEHDVRVRKGSRSMSQPDITLADGQHNPSGDRLKDKPVERN